ncbi:MAG: nucleotide sugar dehydrogenase [Anaerolineae bacterium]|nr:nucleotide sugar dehydrogenase [Anaerolineae bacterium]MDK1081355.1 nucleotide sugar dehydrogenase [Anaerolineae bacterium]MDK1118267.1 nucleotide sugar dehydrogenase [Anaerolineae bacterium]
MKFQKICVLGLGYIGLPTASTFATHGIQVVGVDVNQRVLETLKNGGIHIHEPGLRTLVEAALKSEKLTVSNQPEAADAFLIAVPTPFYEDKTGEYNEEPYKLADMRAVTSAAEAIVPYLKEGNLVVLESTSPPRTTVDLLKPILERSGLKAGTDFYLSYSPERVLPGQILRELIENARVIGGVTPESAQVGAELYETFVEGEIIQTDATTAEMVKLMENTSRDINIAVANEFARLSDRFGVDVWEAIKLANLHPRINILTPGVGVGGHCISVDPWFFVEGAPDLTPLIYTARKVNDEQPHFVMALVQKALGALKGKKIAVLGLAYKPDVDDLRESPAVEVVKLLSDAGAEIRAFEPFKPQGSSGITMSETLEDAVKDSDAILVLVRHKQFKDIKPSEIEKMTLTRLIIDTVNTWDFNAWNQAGFQVYRLGANKL